MNEYFQWRLFVEQTSFLVMGFVILLFAVAFLVLTGYGMFAEYRRKHWRLLIRTSRYAGKYEGWVPYTGEPGHKVLLKWKASDTTLTGGAWIYLKDLSDANFFDKLRAGKNA